ncbi:hypothetical protein LTR95_016833 [Oleoguttula sp. CCFEE 5521]
MQFGVPSNRSNVIFGTPTSIEAASVSNSVNSENPESSSPNVKTCRHDSTSPPLLSWRCIRKPSVQDAIALLRTLPLRADSGVRYAHGKYAVHKASRRGLDVPHCATRIDTIAQLKLNVRLFLRMLGKTAIDLEHGHVPHLDGGMIAVRHLIDFRDRRLALLKEFELVTAAQVLMRHLGCKGIVVLNTHLLLNQLGVKTLPDVVKISPSQRKMVEFTMRHDSAGPRRLTSERSSADLCACDEISWSKFMIDYAELWCEEHDYLLDRR